MGQSKSLKVRRLEKQRKQAMILVKKMEQELKKVRSNKNQKQKEVVLLKQKETQRKQLISILDKELKALEASIDSLTQQENRLKNKEEQCKKAYAHSILLLQRKKQGTNPLLFVLSAKEFNQGIRRMRFLKEYAKAHETTLDELRSTQKELASTRINIEENRKGKADLIIVRRKETNKIAAERKERNQEVQTLSKKEKTLKQQKAQQRKKIARLNRQIQRQIEREIAEAKRRALEAEKRRKARNRRRGRHSSENARRAATKGGYPMTAAERALSGSFAHNKGRLPAPVDKNYKIIGHFGVQQHNELSKVHTNNSGIDIEVRKGTNARAVFDGVVTSIFVIEGTKVAIIIRHGNYLTVYSNIVNLRVKKGQHVKRHQKLGRVAVDTYSNKAILNFQVWHERNKLNPSRWIR